MTAKKILILTTGGTIVSSLTSNGLAPVLRADELVEHIPEMDTKVELNTQEVCHIDSTNMNSHYWLLLAEAIKESYEEYDGFVICHGTDTMAYTAAALSYLIQDSAKPIVLTGAQKPIHYEITDAKANIRDSILYASDNESQGVVIVFDGTVIAGTRAKKTKTVSFHAFSSINYPRLAVIHDTKIVRYIHQQAPEQPVKFYSNLNPRIFLLKLIPGTDPELLKNIFKSFDCIIIESFGTGGIPDNLFQELINQKQNNNESEKVIIMTTQVLQEGSNVGVYAVGQQIIGNFNYLEAKDMTLEAVTAKIMWILGQENLDHNKIQKLFYKKINYDLA